jgi:hypothetical protein
VIIYIPDLPPKPTAKFTKSSPACREFRDSDLDTIFELGVLDAPLGYNKDVEFEFVAPRDKHESIEFWASGLPDLWCFQEDRHHLNISGDQSSVPRAMNVFQSLLTNIRISFVFG